MYSRLFNAIFVHIPKTGGQSVEHVFAGLHNLDWRKRGSLLLRKNPRSGQKPRYLAHLLASEYYEKGFMAPDVFASCFKFTTVRNPFDRALSEYRYRSRKRELSFSNFVRLITGSKIDRHLLPQVEFVVDASGKIMVDRAMRFESLEREFLEISLELFGREVPLPHVNKSPPSTGHTDLSEEVRSAIYRRYERDFDYFGYPVGREYHFCNSTQGASGESPTDHSQAPHITEGLVADISTESNSRRD